MISQEEHNNMMHPPVQARQLQSQIIHDKDVSENDASGVTTVNNQGAFHDNTSVGSNAPGTDTGPDGQVVGDEGVNTEGSITTVGGDGGSEEDIHHQEAHEQPLDEDNIPSAAEGGGSQLLSPQEQEVYESSFPSEPEYIPSLGPPRAATTFALFSDPKRFDPESIYDKTHYLTDALKGNLWLDQNSDGLRGSSQDKTLNAAEYDVGIGGVNVQLVHCESNELVVKDGITVSLPNGDGQVPNIGGEVKAVKTSDLVEAGETYTAGEYSFSLDNMEPGRYYIMYQAPQDFRISGNTLPLDMDLSTRKCIPRGGEGNEYMNEVYSKGDLDWEGYCARSIGCFEVQPKFNLKEDFKDLQFMNEENDSTYEGTVSNLVSLPEKNMLNVGMTAERWPLGTAQFADSKITLNFPKGASSSSAENFRNAVMPANFQGSALKRQLEMTVGELFKNGGLGDDTFDIQGVDFVYGEIHEKDSSRRTRFLRGLQGGGSIGVTYTFTTRGKYNPPPHVQLGTIVSDSINADPVGLVKSLKDKENVLPPVFEEIEDANVRHLTLKNANGNHQGLGGGPLGAYQVMNAPNSGDGGLASWAQVPVALLSILIGLLIGVLLFRRVFTRRKQVSDDPLGLYMKKGAIPWQAAKSNPDDKKLKSSKSVRGFKVARQRSDEEKKRKRGYEDDDDEDFASTQGSSRRTVSSRSQLSRGRRRTSGSDNGNAVASILGSTRSGQSVDQSLNSTGERGRNKRNRGEWQERRRSSN